MDGLQKDVAQQTQELASLRASEERERQTLDALHKQRQDTQSTFVQPQTQPQHAPGDAPSGQTLKHEFAHTARQPASTTEAQSIPSPRIQLMAARQALMGGRSEDARRMLALAQTQMVFQPVTPDQPDATGGNSAATEVGYAIRWLDIGSPTQALQQINVALGNIPAADSQAADSQAANTQAANAPAITPISRDPPPRRLYCRPATLPRDPRPPTRAAIGADGTATGATSGSYSANRPETARRRQSLRKAT